MTIWRPENDPAYVKVTLRQVIDAIRQNGLPQNFGTFFKKEDDKIIAACAIGQAAINLKLNANSLFEALNNIPNEEGDPIELGDGIASMNDGVGDDKYIELNVIADTIEKNVADIIDRTDMWVQKGTLEDWLNEKF